VGGGELLGCGGFEEGVLGCFEEAEGFEGGEVGG
jgi:hypothetical protein